MYLRYIYCLTIGEYEMPIACIYIYELVDFKER